MTRRKIFKNLEIRIYLLVWASTAVLALSMYFFLYSQYDNLIMSKLQSDAVAVHQYTELVLDESGFFELNTIEDEQTELYQTIHRQLDEIRHIANILYLYTAKRSDSGELVYVVDGLDLDNELFRHVGDPIEDEIIPDLEQSLRGETVFADEIISTEWGIVYTVFFPFSDDEGNIIGAIGMEFECEDYYNAAGSVRVFTSLASVAMSLVFVVVAYFAVRKIIKRTEIAFVNMERDKIQAEELVQAITNASPIPCHLWDSNMNIIDCNEAAVRLYGYKDKQEYFERWKSETTPEYQPDGMQSSMKMMWLLERAFAEGRSEFEWMHQLPNGSPLPTEVTLVKIEYSGHDIVAGYVRDMRRQRELEKRIGEGYFDELTGAYNKKYMHERLTRLMRIMSRAETTLTVMMVEVDRYRDYCEKNGHKAGEKSLITIAETLKAHARRADDFVVKYSSDVFVMVLPNMNSVGAKMIAEEVLRDIRELKIPHDKSDGDSFVTVSVGVTTGNVYYRQLGEDYIMRADEMLYASKHSGRDKYTYSDL